MAFLSEEQYFYLVCCLSFIGGFPLTVGFLKNLFSFEKFIRIFFVAVHYFDAFCVVDEKKEGIHK